MAFCQPESGQLFLHCCFQCVHFGVPAAAIICGFFSSSCFLALFTQMMMPIFIIIIILHCCCGHLLFLFLIFSCSSSSFLPSFVIGVFVHPFLGFNQSKKCQPG